MQCLTLADGLAQRGGEVQFISAALSGPLRAPIEASGHAVVRIPPFAVQRGDSITGSLPECSATCGATARRNLPRDTLLSVDDMSDQADV